MKKKEKDLADLKANPLKETDILVLRTCNADMSSAYYSDFIWPENGPIEAPDWNDSPRCGHGLHGLAWGCGSHRYLNWDDTAKWLVVRVDKADGFVEFDDKCKYRKGHVIFSGTRQEATALLVTHGACHHGNVVGAVVSAGDSGTATAGENGVLAICYWNEQIGRLVPVIGVIGENGIKPNVMYRLNDAHEFEEVAAARDPYEQGKDIDWSVHPDWMTVIAMDGEGSTIGFSYIPRIVEATQWSMGMCKLENSRHEVLAGGVISGFKGYWKDSIHIRPGAMPEQDHD